MTRRALAWLALAGAALLLAVWASTRPEDEVPHASGVGSNEAGQAASELVGVEGQRDPIEGAPLPGDRQPSASEATETGDPVEGGADGEASPTFVLTGTLAIDPALEVEASPELRVFRSIGSSWVEMARADLQPGDWEPMKIELTGARWFKVRLEGNHLVADERVFTAPRPDEVIYHEFVAERGAEQWYATSDTNNQPIVGARVDVRWMVDNRMVGTHGITSEGGYVLMNGIRPGATYARASCEGYAPASIEPVAIPEEPPVTFEFFLQPASTVRGVCLQDGDPVRDFTVAFWHADWYSIGPQRRSFTGREDGSFELKEVPHGSVFLVASSSIAPGGDPVSLTVGDEVIEGVEIHLIRGAPGKGVVVDAETGEPVPDAVVQSFVRGTTGSAMRWGPAEPVDASGAFRVESVIPGKNRLQVHAPGYATADVRLDVVEGGEADFGEVRLVRPVGLELWLAGAESQPVSQFQVWGEGTTAIPITRFEPQGNGKGLARIDGVSPGKYTLKVWRPDGSTDKARIELAPGDRYRRTFLASGGGSLLIEFLGEPPPPRSSIIIIWPGEDGRDFSRSLWVESDAQTVDVLEPGQVRVELRESSARLVASQFATIQEGLTGHVAFRLGGARQLARVEDREGNAVAGVLVQLRSAHDGLKPWFGGDTGSSGEVDLGAVPAGSYIAQLSHGALGSRHNVPIEVRANQDEPIVFTLDPRASLSLQFLDGDTPVPGVAFHPVDTHGTRLGWISMNADAEGRHELKNLGPGTVRLATRDSRVWPAVGEFAVDAGTVPATFHVRRLGDLVIEVRNTDAVAVSGVALELQFEDGEVVANWIAAGRVGGAASDLVTNTKGQVEITGLPRGLYSWRTARDGEELTGSFEVVASETTTATIVVP